MQNTFIIGLFLVVLGIGIIGFSLSNLSASSLFTFETTMDKELTQNYLATPNLVNPVHLEVKNPDLVIEAIN